MERERDVSDDLVARTDNYMSLHLYLSLTTRSSDTRQVHIPTPPSGRDHTRRTRVEKAPLPPTASNNRPIKRLMTKGLSNKGDIKQRGHV